MFPELKVSSGVTTLFRPLKCVCDGGKCEGGRMRLDYISKHVPDDSEPLYHVYDSGF